MHPRATAHDRRWWTLAVLSFSLLIITIDGTVVNTALPTLARDLDASPSQLQWIVDAYTLVFAGLLLVAGSLGDRFGRQRALFGGLLVFGASSVAAALSGTATQLIASRSLMGVGAALIMPATLSILTDVFQDRAERTKAIGIWAGVSGLGVAIGPTLGGFLLEHFEWGSVFLVNVPVVAIALYGGRRFVPVSKAPVAQPLDPVGAVLSMAGLSALTYGLIEAPSNGWGSGATFGLLGAAVVLLAAFAVWELRGTDHPMVELGLFRNMRFTRRVAVGDGRVLLPVRIALPAHPDPPERARLLHARGRRGRAAVRPGHRRGVPARGRHRAAPRREDPGCRRPAADGGGARADVDRRHAARPTST